MFFLLRPSRHSFIGRVFSGIRSALLVGLGLLLVPHVSEGRVFVERRDDYATVRIPKQKPEVTTGISRIRPVSREEGAELAGKRLSGPVTHVRDGDTVEISGVPVRIANLDCAETESQAGKIATQRLTDLVQGSRMSCDLTGRQSYDREVGTCRLADGRDIGEVLISEGVCGLWH